MTSIITREQVRKTLSAFAVMLLFVRVASPYFHTHPVECDQPSHGSYSSSCAACDIESTAISDAVDPVILPAAPVSISISYTSFECSGFPRTEQSVESFRGPPTLL